MRVVIKQITKFIIIGLSAVVVDLIIYYTLSEFLKINVNVAKACSFLTGTFYTYYLNKRWTWRMADKGNKGMFLTFVMIYMVSLGLNLLVNHLCLTGFPKFNFDFGITTETQYINFLSFKGNKFLAFFFATLASAFLNFFGQKFLVFKTAKAELEDVLDI